MSFLFLCTLIVLATAQPPKDDAGEKYRQEVQETLPDIENVDVANRLRCSACEVSLQEMSDALRKLFAARKKKRPSEDEIVEKLEKVCDEVVPKYGLQMRNNRATELFSKDDQISRAQGTWILRYLQERCGELYNEHSETIIKHIAESDEQLQNRVCKICKKARKTKSDL